MTNILSCLTNWFQCWVPLVHHICRLQTGYDQYLTSFHTMTHWLGYASTSLSSWVIMATDAQFIMTSSLNISLLGLARLPRCWGSPCWTNAVILSINQQILSTLSMCPTQLHTVDKVYRLKLPWFKHYYYILHLTKSEVYQYSCPDWLCVGSSYWSVINWIGWPVACQGLISRKCTNYQPTG